VIAISPRLAAAIGGMILILGVVANTYRLSAAVDRAELALSEATEANEILQTEIENQNAAIESWRAASAASAARAAAALSELDRQASARRKIQDELEEWKRRAGENECDATRRLLLEYPR
jgi:multidrug resistance efflux pump